MHAPAPRSRRAVAIAVTVTTGIVVAAMYLQLVVPWADAWGATADDMARPLPGDAFVPQPYHRLHHVVAIDAAPERVWPWLVQLGRDRAGFYSYHWLENIFLADIHNREVIRPEWQERQVGDFVPAVTPDFLGGALGDQLGWKVTIVEPNAALGLEMWGTFALVPMPDGTTRLIARGLRSGPEPAAAWFPIRFFFDPSHFVMERRMLLRIKELAEGRDQTPDWQRTAAWIGWLGCALVVGATFHRRRRWLTLAASLAAAAVVWYATGDVLGALAAYMGLGLAALGPLLLGWWAGMWIIGLGVLTYAVLALTHDAWIVFGMAFAALATLLAWRLMHK